MKNKWENETPWPFPWRTDEWMEEWRRTTPLFIIHCLVSYTCLFGMCKQLPSSSWCSAYRSLIVLLFTLHIDLSMCPSLHLPVLFSHLSLFYVCSSPCLPLLSHPFSLDLCNPLHFFSTYSSPSSSPCANLVICDCPLPSFHCCLFPLHSAPFSAAVLNQARTVCQMWSHD